MENRLLLGMAASGWAMVLPTWKRLLVLNVAPPPPITPRVMVKRALLCAEADAKASIQARTNVPRVVLIFASFYFGPMAMNSKPDGPLPPTSVTTSKPDVLEVTRSTVPPPVVPCCPKAMLGMPEKGVLKVTMRLVEVFATQVNPWPKTTVPLELTLPRMITRLVSTVRAKVVVVEILESVTAPSWRLMVA